MDRPKYFNQFHRERQNKIRAKFIAPIKDIVGARIVETTDYTKGVPEKINTVIYFGEEIFGVADVRWRGEKYLKMEFSKKNGYLPLFRFKTLHPEIPCFVIWGFPAGGEEVGEVWAWLLDPLKKLEENRTGGRVDRDDELDVEAEVRVPFGWLKTPEQHWTEAGLITPV